MSSGCCGWSAPAAGRSAARSCSEALAIGLGASALGLGVGLLLASGLEGLFGSMGLSLPIAGMSLSGGTVVAAMLVGVGVTLVAAMLPARRATKVAPVAALREAGDAVSRVRLPGRVLRAVTGLVGRPSARIGGSAGRLARTNAMRHPGRTASTASALLIGVALVTAVTVVAKGLQDVSAGSLERRVQATAVVASADGWTPIDPAIERAVGLRARRHRRQLAGPGRRARLRPGGGRQRRRPGHGERGVRLRPEGR